MLVLVLVALVVLVMLVVVVVLVMFTCWWYCWWFSCVGGDVTGVGCAAVRGVGGVVVGRGVGGGLVVLVLA